MAANRLPCVLLVILTACPAGGWLWGCAVVRCLWSDWGSWGRCSQDCGHAGVAYRHRHVIRAASCGGRLCSGSHTDAKACSRVCHNGGTLTASGCSCPSPYHGACCQDCHKQDCTWGSWGRWGQCSQPCGSGGTRTRTRQVVTKRQCGGAACHHGDREHKGCNDFCDNGGTPLYYGCRCRPGFYGICCTYSNALTETISAKLTDEKSPAHTCTTCANGGTRRVHGCQCTPDYYGNCCDHPVFGGESGRPTTVANPGLFIGGSFLMLGFVAGLSALGCYCSNRVAKSSRVSFEMTEDRSRRYETRFPQINETQDIWSMDRKMPLPSSNFGEGPRHTSIGHF